VPNLQDRFTELMTNLEGFSSCVLFFYLQFSKNITATFLFSIRETRTFDNSVTQESNSIFFA